MGVNISADCPSVVVLSAWLLHSAVESTDHDKFRAIRQKLDAVIL